MAETEEDEELKKVLEASASSSKKEEEELERIMKQSAAMAGGGGGMTEMERMMLLSLGMDPTELESPVQSPQGSTRSLVPKTNNGKDSVKKTTEHVKKDKKSAGGKPTQEKTVATDVVPAKKDKKSVVGGAMKFYQKKTNVIW